MRILGALTGNSRSRRELTSATVASLALAVSSKLALLVTSVVLARWLGASQFGIYAYAVSVLMLLNVFAHLGLPTLFIRLAPAYQAKSKWALMRGLLQGCVVAVIRAALVLALLGALVVWLVGDLLPRGHYGTLLWAVAILPALAFLYLASGILRGLHHVTAGQFTDTLLVPLLFLALIAVLQFTGVHLPGRAASETAMAARFAATAVALVTAAWFVARTIPPEVKRITPEYDRATWIHGAVPLVFLGGLTMVNSQTDILMLAAIQGPEAAGIYQAAARGAELVAFSLMILMPVVQPNISRLYALGQLAALQRLITTSTRLAFASSLPVALALIVFSAPVLDLVYGTEFEKGALALSLLSAAQVVNVGAGLVGQILIMTGHERDAAVGLALGACTNVVLNAVLIPVWGLDGAALATGISLVAWNAFLVNRVRVRTGLESGVLRIPTVGRR